MEEVTNFRGEVSPNPLHSPVDDQVTALIAHVGERVRKARQVKGIPRRVLSEMSGVSPRYLAQLEAGVCNISIGLLLRVAIALDHPIEQLLGEEDPWTSDSLRVADLYRIANADVRRKALEILNPEPENAKADRICLIGLRGAGKSTLGARMGAELGVPFVELNREIEEQSGMNISEIMELYGADGYRRLENQALNRIISTYDNIVLAVAGGVVGNPETYNTLLEKFHSIWIKATPQDHMERVQGQGDLRPTAGNPEAMEHLKSLLTSRSPLYARADVVLETTGKPVEVSTRELSALVRSNGFLA
ncbi:MAG: helix-turn-helix transcriptional regulator [Rhodobacterales bacterium]|nr:helix-turn-helix transcriptional regulator [Rhodobacterales bacterium]